MKYSFYVYIFEGKTGAIALTDMEHVGDFELPENAPAQRLTNRLNALLPAFLKQHGLHHFIPLKNPSIETTNDGQSSICYYHNQCAYDIVYQDYPKWIRMPNAPIERELNELYERHGLDGWSDKRCNLLAAEDW